MGCIKDQKQIEKEEDNNGKSGEYDTYYINNCYHCFPRVSGQKPRLSMTPSILTVNELICPQGAHAPPPPAPNEIHSIPHTPCENLL